VAVVMVVGVGVGVLDGVKVGVAVGVLVAVGVTVGVGVFVGVNVGVRVAVGVAVAGLHCGSSSVYIFPFVRVFPVPQEMIPPPMNGHVAPPPFPCCAPTGP